jgi:MerR family transcriptional regulator, light-induced transcriptional regulator
VGRDKDVALFAGELGDALSLGNIDAAEGVLRRALHAGLPAPVILSRIIGPAMYEVGRRWEQCDISVADEHLATAACHQLLAVVYEHLLVARARSRGRVLLACVEGEHHSLGLRMAADVLEGAGYDVTYLGADVPSEALLDSVARLQPDLVGLSATTPEHAAAVARLIPGLRSLDPQLAIAVGGQGFGSSLPAAPGAEIHHDVEGLAEAAQRLSAGRIHTPSREAGAAISPPSSGSASRPSHAAQFEATTASLAQLTRRHASNAYGLLLDAMQDPLTGLWNRRAFDDRMRQLIDDPAERPLSLMLIDLDDFKTINDHFGHQIGDAALQQVASALRRASRSDDFIARLGGDEFIVLLPRTPPAEAEHLAERIRAIIATESSPHFTLSIGIKQCTGDLRSSMLAADIGLYRAKSRGRDTVVVSA